MSERKLVFAPKGLIQELIDKLGPNHPRVIAELEVRGPDGGVFVEVEEKPKKHGMMDLKRGDE